MLSPGYNHRYNNLLQCRPIWTHCPDSDLSVCKLVESTRKWRKLWRWTENWGKADCVSGLESASTNIVSGREVVGAIIVVRGLKSAAFGAQSFKIYKQQII